MRKTPQLAGVAECKNRTVVEMARSMYKEKHLQNIFWAEAMSTSVFLLNVSPTTTVTGMTPYEAWWNRKPNVSFLQVFGSIVYSLIDFSDRTKLENKSENVYLSVI